MDYVGVRAMIGDIVSVGNFVGVITEESERLEANTDYVLQFKIINYGTNNILDHIVYIKDKTSSIITNNMDIANFPVVNIFTDENITKQERLCHIVFRVPESGNYRFGIARTQTSNDTANKIVFDIREVSVEKGSILQGFKDNTTDLYNFIRRCETYFEQNDKRLLLLAKKEDNTKTNAKIEVTNENILLEVNKKVDSSNVIASINMSPETIKIQASQIDMTGSFDLTGTFKCYTDNSNKTGNYLYQSGAMHRGYLEGQSNPTFSSGIWNPDGTNYTGYVSVGYTNSDHIDENGCLWMSPQIGGGCELIYSKLLSAGMGSVSGILYNKDGSVEYKAAKPAADNNAPFGIGHTFDSSISTDGNLNVRSSIYSKDNTLIISYGDDPSNTYAVVLQYEGYMFPKGTTQLGTSANPWYCLISTIAPQVVSDKRKKKNIQYIDDNTSQSTTYSLRTNSSSLTKDDMYNFIRDNLKLATYEMVDAKEEDVGKTELGFIAQDIMDTKVGKYIINDSDPDNLVYDMANRVSVLEGALQIAIKKIEELTQIIKESE